MASLPKIGITLPPHPSDYAGMAAFMRPKVRPFYEGKAWIHMLDPTQIINEPNIDTGETRVEATPVWSGWARIQPIRNTVNSWRANNPTTTRTVQFWVDDPETITFDFKPGLRIVVTDGVNDPSLVRYQYIVAGALNSTQAWQRTIDTTVDAEGRPNYDITGWPAPEDGSLYGYGLYGYGLYGGVS